MKKGAMKYLGIGVVFGFALVLGISIMPDVAEQGSPVEESNVLPVERVGKIEMNHNTIYLWAFDFEDKRCLWATRRGGMAGLTCWNKY